MVYEKLTKKTLAAMLAKFVDETRENEIDNVFYGNPEQAEAAKEILNEIGSTQEFDAFEYEEVEFDTYEDGDGEVERD